jgi:glucose-6-phosphate 1-dehydrogenase
MIQSHLMQVLALVAMEPPTSIAARHIRAEKIKALDAIAPLDVARLGEQAVLGQYAAGKDHRAYHELDGVRPGTTTETFAAAMFHFDNWRWAGTPFYLRSGKRLAQKKTEIVIEFKRPAADLFRSMAVSRQPSAVSQAESRQPKADPRTPNRISIEIAPDPGVSVRFEGKVPGHGMRIDSARMHFDYVERFGAKPVEAYGPLILDAMRGDQTLFPHRLEVEAAWRAVMPLIGPESAALRKTIHANYEPGSWGPRAADALLARHGRAWRNAGAAGAEQPRDLVMS